MNYKEYILCELIVLVFLLFIVHFKQSNFLKTEFFMQAINAIRCFLATFFLSSNIFALSEEQVLHIVERTRPGYEHWLKNIKAKPIINDSQLIFWVADCKDPFANIVMKSSFNSSTDLREAVKRVIAIAKELQTPISWMVAPHAKPADTSSILKTNGFLPVITYEMVELDIQEAIMIEIKNPDIEIRKLDSVSIDAWLNIVSPAFEYNSALTKACYEYLQSDVANKAAEQEHYAGYFKGKLVTTGTLLIEYYGGGHVYDIATVPEAQHNGMATAMMQFIIKRADDLGIKTINLLATDAGKSIYQKLGFKKLFDMDMFVFSHFTESK